VPSKGHDARDEVQYGPCLLLHGHARPALIASSSSRSPFVKRRKGTRRLSAARASQRSRVTTFFADDPLKHLRSRTGSREEVCHRETGVSIFRRVLPLLAVTTPQPHVPAAALRGPSAWPLDCVRCLDFQGLDPPGCRAPHRLCLRTVGRSGSKVRLAARSFSV
jgi:hypothetical protein